VGKVDEMKYLVVEKKEKILEDAHTYHSSQREMKHLCHKHRLTV
jgi:hypothetical protein